MFSTRCLVRYDAFIPKNRSCWKRRRRNTIALCLKYVMCGETFFVTAKVYCLTFLQQRFLFGLRVFGAFLEVNRKCLCGKRFVIWISMTFLIMFVRNCNGCVLISVWTFLGSKNAQKLGSLGIFTVQPLALFLTLCRRHTFFEECGLVFCCVGMCLIKLSNGMYVLNLFRVQLFLG